MNRKQRRAWRTFAKSASKIRKEIGADWCKAGRAFWKKKSSVAIFPEVIFALITTSFGIVSIVVRFVVFVCRYVRAA